MHPAPTPVVQPEAVYNQCLATKRDGFRCLNAVPRGQCYCKQSHHRERILHQLLQRFRADGDLFGEELVERHSLFGERRFNPLQPQGPIAAISRAAGATTLSQFVRLIENFQYLAVVNAIMAANPEGQKLTDIRARANELAAMLTPAMQVVTLMDGHGRLLLAFCKAVIQLHGEARLNALQIELVDIDAKVTEYHRSFYTMACPNVICITKNIFDPSLAPRPDRLSCFNFCGVKPYIGELQQMVRNQTNPLMISFATSRRAASKNYDRQVMSAALSNLSMTLRKLDTGRGKQFMTFVLERKPVPVVANPPRPVPTVQASTTIRPSPVPTTGKPDLVQRLERYRSKNRCKWTVLAGRIGLTPGQLYRWRCDPWKQTPLFVECRLRVEQFLSVWDR